MSEARYDGPPGTRSSFLARSMLWPYRLAEPLGMASPSGLGRGLTPSHPINRVFWSNA